MLHLVGYILEYIGHYFMPRPLFTPGKDPVPVVQEAGWAPGRVWTGVENLAPTGIRSPDRVARGQSLYRLRYPAHIGYIYIIYIYIFHGPTAPSVPWPPIINDTQTHHSR